MTIALVVLCVILKRGRFLVRLEKSPQIKRTLNGLVFGLKAFNSPGSAAAISLLALLQWFMNALNYYWLALAFSVENTVTLAKSVLLSFTGAAASSAPGMPGYFGNFELAVSTVIAGWGISKETSLAYSVAAHLLSYLIITTVGLFFAYQMGQSLERIWTKFSEKK